MTREHDKPEFYDPFEPPYDEHIKRAQEESDREIISYLIQIRNSTIRSFLEKEYPEMMKWLNNRPSEVAETEWWRSMPAALKSLTR